MSQVEGSPPPPPTKDDLYYGAVVAGWLNTKLERDKSILTLSAGGIGLLVTLMTTVGPQTTVALVLYGVAIVAFAVSLYSIIRILDRNAHHLKQIVRGEAERDSRLALLDRISFGSFIVGAVLLGAVGLMAGIDKLGSQTGAHMSKSDQPAKTTTVAVPTHRQSYDGISDMRPPVAQQTPAAPPAAPPAATPAAVTPAAAPPTAGQAPAAPQAAQDAGGGSK